MKFVKVRICLAESKLVQIIFGNSSYNVSSIVRICAFSILSLGKTLIPNLVATNLFIHKLLRVILLYLAMTFLHWRYIRIFAQDMYHYFCEVNNNCHKQQINTSYWKIPGKVHRSLQLKCLHTHKHSEIKIAICIEMCVTCITTTVQSNALLVLYAKYSTWYETLMLIKHSASPHAF